MERLVIPSGPGETDFLNFLQDVVNLESWGEGEEKTVDSREENWKYSENELLMKKSELVEKKKHVKIYSGEKSGDFLRIRSGEGIIVFDDKRNG